MYDLSIFQSFNWVRFESEKNKSNVDPYNYYKKKSNTNDLQSPALIHLFGLMSVIMLGTLF
jgi:hypothetical protein